MLIEKVPILINKDIFKLSYNDLKLMVQEGGAKMAEE